MSTNTYAPVLNNSALISLNVQALLALGVTKTEASRFSGVKFNALPLWIRTRVKRAFKSAQPEPRKLNPAAGELAFYIASDRFPKMAELAQMPAKSVQQTEQKMRRPDRFRRHRNKNRQNKQIAVQAN